MVKEGRALRATSRGRVLSAFLQQYFSQYVDYVFTSDMESQLDDVAGDLARLQCTHCISEHTHTRTHERTHARTHSLSAVHEAALYLVHDSVVTSPATAAL